MFADPNNSPSLGPALVTAIGAGIVAVIAAGVGIWNSRKLRDLERLKKKREHGQLINSTQWTAEFSAYQALWKAMVSLRAATVKLTQREDDLAALGVHKQDLNPALSFENKQKLLDRFSQLLSDSMLAINENAPFYPADIRRTANKTHDAAHHIYTKHVAALVAVMKKLPEDTDTHEELKEFIQEFERIEEMIRDRLGAVRVLV